MKFSTNKFVRQRSRKPPAKKVKPRQIIKSTLPTDGFVTGMVRTRQRVPLDAAVSTQSKTPGQAKNQPPALTLHLESRLTYVFPPASPFHVPTSNPTSQPDPHNASTSKIKLLLLALAPARAETPVVAKASALDDIVRSIQRSLSASFGNAMSIRSPRRDAAAAAAAMSRHVRRLLRDPRPPPRRQAGAPSPSVPLL